MACKKEKKFPLRLLVDEERNWVVVAEASGDFTDTLFSFLTLPLGTIIRLVSNEQQHDQLVEIGCINNLYRSVEKFEADVFWNKICKQMLLRPRNPCESLCQKLKLNVDDTEPTKYFMCRSSCPLGWDPFWLSTFADASCCSCGKLMNKKLKLLEDPSEETHGDGVFVKGEAKYLVFDDLKVIENSPNNLAKELVQRGCRDFNKLKKMDRNVGLKEILNLLKQALTSKSPLSNVLLANRTNRESEGMYTFSPKIEESWCSAKLKVIVRKSEKKIFYVEAEEDFVNFLFSFLTAPLGSILKLLDGCPSLGCMDILYNSVKDFNSPWFVGTSKTTLLDPRVAPQFGFSWLPMQLNEQATPTYRYGTSAIKKNICNVDGNGVISKNSTLLKNPGTMRLVDPRSPDGKSNEGFVRRPLLFGVWDDLEVTPLTNTSSISLMQNQNIPLDDLEEHVVTIGEAEALNLLWASLSTSKAVLTEVLSYLLNEPHADAKA